MTFQGRSATSERPCMILPMKSKEIHQRFGDHKTLMNEYSMAVFQKNIYQMYLPYLDKNIEQ